MFVYTADTVQLQFSTQSLLSLKVEVELISIEENSQIVNKLHYYQFKMRKIFY